MLQLAPGAQAAIRKKICELGLLQEKLRGVPARMHYRVDPEKYRAFLGYEVPVQFPENPESSFPKTRKLDSGKPGNKIPRNPETIGSNEREEGKEKGEKNPPVAPFGSDLTGNVTPPPKPPCGGPCSPSGLKSEKDGCHDAALDQLLFGEPAPVADDKPVQAESVGSTGSVAGDAVPPKKARGTNSVTFRVWLNQVLDPNDMAIRDDDPIFSYIEKAGIPDDFLHLQWHEFKQRYSLSDKKYTDWREVFRKSVRGNWFRLWAVRPGEKAVLTTVGVQASRVMAAEETEQEAA